MKTNFFSLILHFLEDKNASLSLTKKDERIYCSVVFTNLGKKGDNEELAGPIIISGTADELDEGFIEALNKPIEKVNKILGLKVDDSALDESDDDDKKSDKKEKAKVEKVEKVKSLPAKEKKALEKAEEYIKLKEYEKATVHVKSICVNNLNHPDVIAILHDIEELEKKDDSETLVAETVAEESPASEETFEAATEESPVVVEEKKEEVIQLSQSESDAIDNDFSDDSPKVEPEKPKTVTPAAQPKAEEKKVVAQTPPPVVEKKEETPTASDNKDITHDENGVPLSNMMLLQKVAEFNNNKQYAKSKICLQFILKIMPTHIVAKTKLAEIETFLTK